MARIQNFVDGKPTDPLGGKWLDVHEPATGNVYARVAAGGQADVDAAVGAACRAFPAWSGVSVEHRSRTLFRLADLMEARIDEFAAAESRDTGKPVSLARNVDIPRAAANLRFFAGAVLHTSGLWHETDTPAPGGMPGHAINYTLRRPRGVAGLISPWNLPLYLLTWKIGPALATGNTAVCKPSEVTPMTASMLASLCSDAGLPPGVLNIVHGAGQEAGAALVQHPDVPTISFTGSTAVGRWIGSTAGESLKRVSLELGGKNPFIVFGDADLDEALAQALRAGFTNQGQVCLCGSRIYVERSIFDSFLARLTAEARALKIGDPADPTTQQGSLVSEAHWRKVDACVHAARRLGATVHCGGGPVAQETLPARCRGGWFYQPTVMTGLDPACAVEQEEIFGPVVSVTPFDTEDQAVHLANGTKYGLAATLFTRDVARAHRVASRLEAGIIWVNCWLLRDLRTPFGGMKQSGVGREGGEEALKFFTEARNICVRT